MIFKKIHTQQQKKPKKQNKTKPLCYCNFEDKQPIWNKLIIIKKYTHNSNNHPQKQQSSRK